MAKSTRSGRVPNAVQYQNNAFARVDLAGTIKLTNYRDKTVDVEVTRNVLGNVTAADNGGAITKVNVLEDGTYMTAGDRSPWWRSYNWPPWWSHSTASDGSPGKSASRRGRAWTSYSWHYFWR